MKEITITIDRSAIDNEVSKATAYIGSKAQGEEVGNEYSRLYATEEAVAEMDDFFDNALSLVGAELRQFATGEWDKASLSIKLNMPELWSTNLKSSLEQNIQHIIACVMTSSWLAKYIGSERAKEYSDDASSLLADVRAILYHRDRPKRNNE